MHKARVESVIEIVAPVFGIVAVGYLCARFRYLPENAGDALSAFVFKLAVPILLMRSIATAEFSNANPIAYFAVYFSGVLVAWLGAWILIAGIVKRGHRASVIAGVGASFSNIVLLGIPLVQRAYGAEGLQILFLLVTVHMPIMMTASTFLMEYAVRGDGVDTTPVAALVVARRVAHNLAVNPIVIGIAIGLAWRFFGPDLTGWKWAGYANQTMSSLAGTTGALALFSLGMGLIKYGIKGNIAPAFGLAVLSLIVMPATVYVVGTYVIPLPPFWLKVAILAAACPTGVNAFLFATYFNIAHGLASNAIVLSLLGSVVTIPFWLVVV